jgi:hypothetical protein
LNEGTNFNQDIFTVPDQVIQVGKKMTRWKYGSIGHGRDLTEEIWSEHEHVFSSQTQRIKRKNERENKRAGSTKTSKTRQPERMPSGFFGNRRNRLKSLDGVAPRGWTSIPTQNGDSVQPEKGLKH